jgi:hypothetical protein
MYPLIVVVVRDRSYTRYDRDVAPSTAESSVRSLYATSVCVIGSGVKSGPGVTPLFTVVFVDSAKLDTLYFCQNFFPFPAKSAFVSSFVRDSEANVTDPLEF